MAIIDNDLFTQTNPNPNSPRNNPSLAGQLTNLNNEVTSIEDTLVQGYVRESASVSYVSASSFTVSGNVTAIYTRGRIVRFSDGSTGIVFSSSYTNPNTTVTMLTGTVPSSLSYVDIAIQARGQTSGLASRVLGNNNVPVVSQKDNTGTERDILKLDSSNNLIIGGAGINKAIFNTPFDGWIAANETWTYASSTSFTVSGDVTGKYQKGDKIKLTQSSVKYFYIIGVSYSAPNTTITITGGSNYSLTNAAITDNYYSKAENPQGFPTSFSYTPTAIGLTNPVYEHQSGRFRIIGNRCVVAARLRINSWSAQSGYIRISLPVTASSIGAFYGSGTYFRSGGSSVDGATTVEVNSTQNAIVFIRNTDAVDACFWESSALVVLFGQVEYEI